MNDVYYKIYLNTYDEIEIICLQYFDESEYMEDRWLSAIKFGSEHEAKQFLQEYKLDKINSEIIVRAIREYLEISFKHILDKEGVNE